VLLAVGCSASPDDAGDHEQSASPASPTSPTSHNATGSHGGGGGGDDGGLVIQNFQSSDASDAGTPEAGTPDAGAPEAGTSDAGSGNAGGDGAGGSSGTTTFQPTGPNCSDDNLPPITGSTYDVGPGQAYAELKDVPWAQLNPGDGVLIHPRSTPYLAKVGIGVSGAPGKPIIIRGLRDVNGNVPHISGNGAVENPDAAYWTDQVANVGIITLAPVDGSSAPPAYIEIDDLAFSGIAPGDTFTAADGSTQDWWEGAAAVTSYGARDVTISGADIHDVGNGIFSKNVVYPNQDTSSLVIRCSKIGNNGVVGSDRRHNVYNEADGITYEFNYFYPPRDGSGGVNVKDRSAGFVFRYNWVVGGSHQLDLVDPEDDPGMAGEDSFKDTLVYGNVFVNPPGSGASSMIHFGGDSGVTDIYRPNLDLVANTFVNIDDQSGGRYYTAAVKADTADQTVYAYNNVFANYAPSGGAPPDFYFLFGSGTFNLASNLAPSYHLDDTAGPVNGLDGIVTSDDAGFVDWANGDYRLASGSPAMGIAGPLGGAVQGLVVDRQPVFGTANDGPIGWEARPSTQNVGAWEK
jgi:hypothetical protein